MYIPAKTGLGQAPLTTPQISSSSRLQSTGEATQLRAAIARGVHDPAELTNLVFFSRHPERQGRKLDRGEPRFTQLAQEWLHIRDALVRPILVSAAPGRTAPAAPISPPASLPQAAGPAPRLIEREDSPRTCTLYVEIPLGIGWAANRRGKQFKVQPMTGIFIPKDYRPHLGLDLILYLHGFKETYPGDSVSINRYWDSQKFPFFGLRERLNDSGKNVILVAPTLGPKSQAGNLTKPGGFNSYLDQLVAALAAHGPHRQAAGLPRIGNIILACHSGGGSPMLKIVGNQDAYTTKIQECWGFDCLYSGYADKEKTKKLFTQPQRWLKWAEAERTKKLFIYYQSSTAAESQYLARMASTKQLSNVLVARSKAADHFWVPLTHWKERIMNAPFLVDRLNRQASSLIHL